MVLSISRCRGATTGLVVLQQHKHFSVLDGSASQVLLAYNTRTRQKESLRPRVQGILATYICGPTVYDSMHLGHAYTYTQFDIVRRIIEFATGNRMLTCINITDIDDKIIKRASEKGFGSSQTALADRHEQEFWRVLQLLNVRRPEIVAPVSKYIPTIILYIEKLISDGHAYLAPSGSVYFDVKKCGSRYGSLRSATETTAGGEEMDQEEAVLHEKKNPVDFAVWKHARPDVFGADEPQWAVPWDENHRGRPGWHTECAALANLFFDRHVDIHFGGSDLQFPHHENECAQNLCFHGMQPTGKNDAEQQWVRHWLHFGTLLNARGEKMSKSKQNFIGAEEFLLQYGASAGKLWRMFCCLNHYRSHPVYRTEAEAIENFSSMSNVRNVLAQINQFRSLVHAYLAGRLPINASADELSSDFLFEKLQVAQADMLKCILDDFDVPGSITVFLALLQQISAVLSRSTTIASSAVVSSPSSHRHISLAFAVPLANYLHFADQFYTLLGLQDDAENPIAVNINTGTAKGSSAAVGAGAGSYSQSYVERLIDDTVAFRSHVRQAAISLPAPVSDAADGAESCKKVLLDGCDALRDQLASRASVLLRDSKQESFWLFAGASADMERKAPVENFKSNLTTKDTSTAAPKQKIFIKKTKQQKSAKATESASKSRTASKATAVAGEAL